MKLDALQKEFLAALLSGDAGKLAGEIAPDANLAIYRNNVFTAMENALALTFPCVQKLVGERFFALAARDFACASPPAGGNLDEFGHGFPSFLQAYAPAASVPYLPDMARLEWLMQESALAGRGAVMDGSALGSIPPEKYFSLHLHLHPSVRLMASRYPLYRIHEFCVREEAEPFDLAAEGGAQLLVVRPWRKVDVHALHRADHAFLQAVAAGQAMPEAFAAASAEDEGFDLAGFIHKQLGYGSFSGFSLGR